jgi:TRAP-type C4-dicarboxylate transport system permease small subunit
MLQSLKSVFEKCNLALGLLSGAALFFAGIILFIEVVCRYSGNPTDWIPEVSVHLFAGAMLLGASYTLMREKHVRVDLVLCRFPPRIQDICFFFTSLGGVAFCLLVARYGWLDLLDVIETGETTATTLRTPLWLVEMPVPLGFSLLAIQFFIQACGRAHRLQKGSPLEAPHTGGGH